MDNLIEALMDVIEAKAEFEKEKAEYTGYDWGYHSYHARNRLDYYTGKFKAELQTVIAEEVKRQLGERL